MKVLLIGRGDNCHIQIEDSRVSRQHALLKLYPLGKIEIVDQSTNGTAVNGVKIKHNVPKRVTRGDVVTFAEAVKLDWSQVPDPSRIYKIGGAALLAVLGILLALVLGLRSRKSAPLPEQNSIPPQTLPGALPDSTAPTVPAQDLDALQSKIDSLKRAEERKRHQREKKLEEEQEAEQDQAKKEEAEAEESFGGVNPIII